MIDTQKIRQDFPILARKINGRQIAYLDSAATSQKPKHVIDAISRYYRQNNANIHRGIHTLSVEVTEAYEEVRQKVAAFIGVADCAEIVFVRNATEAINLVAYSWGRLNISKGDEIVLTIAEHHSNFVPWQQLAHDVGAVLKVVPIRPIRGSQGKQSQGKPIDLNGELDLLAFQKALTTRTKLVTFFHVSNVLGVINDVNRLSSIVHRKAPKAKILIDGAQAVPHMPVDISKIGCDFYVFSGHKMLGPAGIGVLWGKREILEAMPPFLFGGEMISKVTLKKTSWNDLPWKFEAGTPNIEGVIGLGAAVDYLSGLGMENVRRHEMELTEYALNRLSRIQGIRLLGPIDLDKRCGVISFNIGNIPPHDVASILDSVGVEIRSGYNCAEPLARFLGSGPVARVSFYIYNTVDEIDRLMDGLRKVQKIFQKTQKTQKVRKSEKSAVLTFRQSDIQTI